MKNIDGNKPLKLFYIILSKLFGDMPFQSITISVIISIHKADLFLIQVACF